MNPLRRLALRAGFALKAFGMIWSARARSWYFGSGLGLTKRDYRGAVGDGRGSALIMSCVLCLCRAFPEAPLRVRQREGRGARAKLVPVDDHPLVALVERPNPYYDGDLLWQATLTDWLLTGNAYWVKIRAAAGRVVAVYWVPAAMVEPRWGDEGSGISDQFISYYEYDAGGNPVRLPPGDVVHFRHGLDPDNVRKGFSPIASLLREVYTDDTAANYSASMLTNMGVPGLMISPDGEDLEVSQEEKEKIKTEANQRFGGDNVGSTMVFGQRMKAQILSFSPQQMAVKDLRRIPEERVAALLGTPAGVVGLGAGLDRNTFSNLKEGREALYESNLIPTQRLIAAALKHQLLPDFAAPTGIVLDFDLSNVRILQEDQNALHQRARDDLGAGLIRLNEAREMIGLEPDPNGDIYYVASALTPTEPDNLIPPEPQPMALLPDSGGTNGTGNLLGNPPPVQAAAGTNGTARRNGTTTGSKGRAN